MMSLKELIFGPAPKSEPEPAPEEEPVEEKSILDQNREFIQEHKEELDEMFSDYPEISFYQPSTDHLHDINLWFRPGHYPDDDPRVKGYLLFDEEGKITGWRSREFLGTIQYKRIEHNYELEAKTQRIGSMLSDSETARKYTDSIARQLFIDDLDHQAFNVMEALSVTEDRFKAEYYDEEWLQAWRNCLTKEFDAKSVTGGENGVFVITPK